MPQWKKITPGVHHCRIGGASKVLKMDGKVFEAEDHELGLAFLNQFKLIGEPKKEKESPVNVLVAKHKGRGRWVVINQSTGLAVNHAFLTKKEASAMVEMDLFEDKLDICPDCLREIEDCICGEVD